MVSFSQPGLYSKFKDRKDYIVSKQTDRFKVAEGPIEQMSILEREDFSRRQLQINVWSVVLGL